MIKKLINKLNSFLEYPLLLKTLNRSELRGFVKKNIDVKRKLNFYPKTIIDVGAATGLWSEAARIVFPEVNIYAFEPIKESFTLMKIRMKEDKNFKSFNYALSDEKGKIKFDLNEFPDSSSILKMTERHKIEFPQTNNSKTIDIYTFRLDSLLDIDFEGPVFLKMDVQGAELKVLKGAENIYKKIDAIQLELNFENFYENQATYNEICEFMITHGFNRFFQLGTLDSKNNNDILACDLVFLR